MKEKLVGLIPGRNQFYTGAAFVATLVGAYIVVDTMEPEKASMLLDWSVIFVPTMTGILNGASMLIKRALAKNGNNKTTSSCIFEQLLSVPQKSF